MASQFLYQRPTLIVVYANKPMYVHRVDKQEWPSGRRVPEDGRARLIMIFLLCPLQVFVERAAVGAFGMAVQADQITQSIFPSLSTLVSHDTSG